MGPAQGIPGARPPAVLNAMHVHTMTLIAMARVHSLVVVWLISLVYNKHQKPSWQSDAVIGESDARV